jgi:hypothetical protein
MQMKKLVVLVGASDDYLKRYFNELPETFDPAAFNPAAIAKMAKLAGMKYVVRGDVKRITVKKNVVK